MKSFLNGFFLLMILIRLFPVSAETDADRFRYRYWMIPADKISSAPWGEERYCPVALDRFEAWIEAFSKSEDRELNSAAGIASLSLEGTLNNGALSAGEGKLTFGQDADETHPFILTPCSPAVSSFRMDDGTEISAGSDGRSPIAIRNIRKESTLKFSWSLAQEKSETGEQIYHFSLPPAASIELKLTLPETLEPVSENGIVSRLGKNGPQSVRWQIEPGPGGDFRIELRGTAEQKKMSPLPGVSERISYRVSLEGIEMTYTALFDSSEGFPETLSLSLDEPFLPEQIFWKSRGEEAGAVWEKTGHNQKVILPVPKFSQNEESELTLTAFAPFTAGEKLRIPSVHTDPNEIDWKETEIHSLFESPVTPDDYIFTDAGRIFSAFRSANEGKVEAFFQLYARTGAVEIPLRELEEKVSADSATEVRRGDGEMRFRTDLLLQANLPGIRRFSIPIRSEWKAESAVLNSEPISFRTGNSQDGTGYVTLAFSEPIPVDHTMRIRIEGRCEITDSGIPLSLFYPFVLPNRISGSHLTAIEAESPTKVTLVDGEGNTIPNPPVDEETVRSLFEQLPNGTILSFNDADPDIRVRFDRTVPAYTAKISGKISVTANRMNEEWLLRCTPPAGTRVDRLLLSFSADAAESDWKWSMTESDTGDAVPLTEAALLPDEKKGFKLGENQKAWEILLPTPRSAPFTIRLKRERAADLTAELPVPLLALLDTPNQNGEISLTSPDFSAIRPIANRLIPLSSPIPAEGVSESSIGSFTYTPSDLLRSPKQVPSLTLTPSGGSISRGWCRFLRVESEYSPEGLVRNRAVCFLENAGRPSVQVTFPEPIHLSSIESILRDGTQVKYRQVSENERTVEIPLVPDKRFVTLTIEYRDRLPRFGFSVFIPKRIPNLNIPILSGNWIARIPTEYEPREKEPRSILPISSFTRESLENRKLKKELTERVEQFLVNIGNRKKPLTWSEFLTSSDYLPALLTGSPEITVSRSAMNKLKIKPDTLIQIPESPTPAARGIDALAQSGLVIAVTAPNQCALLLRSELDLNPDPFSTVGSDSIRIARNPLPLFTQADFVTVSEWCGTKVQRSARHSAFSAQAVTGSPVSDTPGHTLLITPIESSLTGRILINSCRLAVLKWFLFLAAAAAGIRIGAGRTLSLTAAFFLLYLAAGSKISVSLFWGLFLGFGTAFLFILVRYHSEPKPISESSDQIPEPSDPESPEESEQGFVRPDQMPGSSAGITVALLLLLPGTLLSSEQNRSFPVFVPAEENAPAENQPAWIPEELYRRMTEWEQGTLETDRNVRIESALYEGYLNYNRDTGDYSLFRLTAKYRLVTEGSEASIRLPMMPIIPQGGILIDGTAGNILFSEEEGELRLEIRKIYPGPHSLDLILLPAPFNEKEETGTVINIPAVPDSKLILRIPSDVPIPRVEGSQGEVSQTVGLLTADLGQIGSFTLKPPENTGKKQDVSLEADHSYLLKIDPSQILLRGTFRLRITGGRSDGVTILADPRYKLTRCTCEETPLLPIPEEDAQNPEKIRIPFKKSVSGSVTLRADFVPRDFGGIGELPVPSIRIADAAVAGNRMTVVSAPETDVTLFGAEQIPETAETAQNPITTSESSGISSEMLPGYRKDGEFDLSKPEQEERHIAIRPAPGKQHFTESGSCRFRTRETDLEYTAEIETDGPLNRLTVKTPENFTVDSVLLTESFNSDQIPLRTSQEGSLLRVFFERPLRGKYRFELRGRSPLTCNTEILFPFVGITGIPCGESEIRFACSDTLYSIFNPPGGWTPLPTDTPRLKRWSIPASAALTPQPPIEIKVNRPSISLSSESYFFPNSSGSSSPELGPSWELFTELNLSLSDGELDRIEFEIDDSFSSNAFKIETGKTITTQISRLDTGERVLTLIPSEPIRDKIQIRCEGIVHREDLRLPKFRFRRDKTLTEENRKIFLPSRNGEKPLNWKTENLTLSDSTEVRQIESNGVAETYFPFGNREHFPKQVLDLSNLKREEFIEYRPSGPGEFSAQAETNKDISEIIGMETAFFLRSDGSYSGDTTMDVRIGNTVETELEIPDGTEILQVNVDGIPASISKAAEANKVRLHFIHEHPVCRIRIQFNTKRGWIGRPISLSGHSYTEQHLKTVRFSGSISRASLWSVVFESDRCTLPCYVAQQEPGESYKLPVHELRGSFSEADSSQELPESGHWKHPVSYDESAPIRVRLNMAKMSYMLNLLENVLSATGGTGKPQPENWLTRWHLCWNQYSKEAETYFNESGSSTVFSTLQKNAIFTKFESQPERSFHDSVAEFDKILNGAARENFDRLTNRYTDLTNVIHFPDPSQLRQTPNTDQEAFRLPAVRNADIGIIFGFTDTEAGEYILFKPVREQKTGLWYKIPAVSAAFLILIFVLCFGKTGLINRIRNRKEEKAE